MEIIVEVFIKSEKLLKILIKLLNPEILFCKSQISLQIQKLSLNPEIKIFCKSEKIFCHVLLAPAVSQRQSFFPPFCRIQNGRGAGVGKEFLIVYNMKYVVLP